MREELKKLSEQFGENKILWKVRFQIEFLEKKARKVKWRERERESMGRERVAEGESKRERESQKETEAVLEDTDSPSFSVCLPVALFLSKKRNRRLKFNPTQVFAKCNAKAKKHRSRKSLSKANLFEKLVSELI